MKLPSLKYANMCKLLHGTATKGTLNISRENAILTQKAAVSGTFNAVTAWPWQWLMWLERCWGGWDGCTACRLQRSISQSVSAANISKLRERYGRPRNLHGFLTCFIKGPGHEGPSGSATEGTLQLKIAMGPLPSSSSAPSPQPMLYRALKKRMELLIPYYYYICLLFLSMIYHSLSLLGMAPCRLTHKCPNDMAETKLLHNYGPCRISCSGLPNLPKTVLLSHANAQIGGPLL